MINKSEKVREQCSERSQYDQQEQELNDRKCSQTATINYGSLPTTNMN